MNTRRDRTPLLPVLLLCLLAHAPAASADRIRLANGNTLVGVVRDLGDTVELTLPSGAKIILARSSIAAIEKTDGIDAEYLSRAAHTSDSDPGAQVDLAVWCNEHRLVEKARDHLRKALLIDPHDPRALKALGYIDLGKAWPDLPKGWETVSSAHVCLSSPLARHEARALADDLEILFLDFSETYSALFHLRVMTEPVQLRLYLDSQEFADAARKEFQVDVAISEKARAHLDGFADPRRNLIVAKINPQIGPKNRETIYHEMTHVMMHGMLEQGKRISAATKEELERIRKIESARMAKANGLMWFHEGLANYYGGSSISEGKFVPGAFMQGGQTSISLARLQQAIRDKEALPLDAIVNAGVEEFLGDHYDLYYTEAWMLVHFLQQFQAGKFRAKWFRLVDDLRKQDGGVEGFKRVFGFAPSQLEADWKQYALDMHEGQ